MFRKLYDWVLKWASAPQAVPALGVISFVESSFFPIPADVLFVPMVLSTPERAYRLALVATITSVLGGVFGWMIGHYAFELLAQPLLEFWGKMEAFDALKTQTGTGTILLLLVTSGLAHLPPMKVVTILSGVVSFNLPLFILSAIMARGGRFFLLAWLLKTYGQPMADFVERRFTLIAAALLGLALLVWAGMKLI